ncbi:MAG: xanthine dehydrogenase family protein molybdopterin-binding subunit [Fidelibacterota bacterium]
MTISKSIKRTDAREKIRGEAQYIGDMAFDNPLYLKTIRSTRPHAKILGIHLPDLPEGFFIIDKSHIPGKNRMRTVVSDHPILAEDEVLYIGQPILLVAGPSRELVYQISEKIRIDYEDLPAVFTLEESVKQNCVFTEYSFSKGEPDTAFAQAARIIEDEYRTGLQEHIYLEPQGMAAEVKDDTVFVYGSMQCPFYVEDALTEALGRPANKIRVVQTTTGGAFGGKEEFPSLTACHTAIAALATHHPVILIYDRDEDIICSTKRHPSIIRYKVGLDDNNRVTVLDIDLLYDAGAYCGLSPVVLQRGIFSATNVYNFHHLKVHGRNFRTHTVPSGAFRGFGAPQSIFGTEMLMHNIAVSLGLIPLEFKMKHILKQGDPSCTGGKIHDKVILPELVERALDLSDYRQKIQKKKKFAGVGISLFLHGCGFTGNGEQTIKGKIILRKSKDRVVLKVSSVEMGQGADTVLRKIVAHALDLPIEKVTCEIRDTGLVPDSGPTVASRTTMIVGGLLKTAADEMKSRWNEAENFEISKEYHHPDFLTWDNDTFQGNAYPTYSWGVNVAEITIDPVTYDIHIEKVTGVYDIGRAIDERALRGQMEGGIAQGAGWATLEVMKSKEGRLVQHNLTDYKVPTSMDVPEITCDFIDNPYEFGPFGAKCAGELPMSGAPPAVAAAISNALGIPLKEIPVTPEMLMELEKHED